MKANGLEKLDSNSAEWDKILISYKAVSEKDSKFKFSGTIITEKSQLQKQCEETFKKRAGEDNESNNYYNKAKRWCTVPTSVQKILETSRTILGTDANKDDVNREDWNKKIKDYTSLTNKDKITSLDLGAVAISDPQKDNRDKIKAECKKLNEKHSYEEDYEEAIKKSQTWCSIEKKST